MYVIIFFSTLVSFYNLYNTTTGTTSLYLSSVAHICIYNQLPGIDISGYWYIICNQWHFFDGLLIINAFSFLTFLSCGILLEILTITLRHWYMMAI